MRQLAFFALLFATTVPAQGTRVLFIGNSYIYSNDLPNTFRQLALSLGEEVTVTSSTPGGYQFEQHAAYAPTQSAVASQPWDFVVLQEQSQLGALPFAGTQTDEGAAALVDLIEANNECTWPVFFMTWGRQNGDDLNCPNYPYMCTYEGMQQGLRDNYVELAEDLGGYAAPVGWAWKAVRETAPGIALYASDGSHPSVAGSYLAACVFHCTLFQTSVIGASYIAGLDPNTATTLQTIATNTVLGASTTWNMDVANGTDANYTSVEYDGPNTITYQHVGQGTHSWTSSNGQTSNTGDATFTFDAIGTYTISHVYNDPCGNTDTATWTVEITTVGMPESITEPMYVIADGPGQLRLKAPVGSHFTLTDMLGRTIHSRIVKQTEERIHILPGTFIWDLRTPYGRTAIGRCIVP